MLTHWPLKELDYFGTCLFLKPRKKTLGLVSYSVIEYISLFLANIPRQHFEAF